MKVVVELVHHLWQALFPKSEHYPAPRFPDSLGQPQGAPDGQVQAQDQQLEALQLSLGVTQHTDCMDG